MNVWSKLLAAVRGGVNEIGEELADSQALRILDQEIREADGELKTTREALASMMARQKISEEAVKKLEAKIEEYEGYALKALEKGDEALALEVAEKIAGLEAERGDEFDRSAELAENVASLRRSVAKAENSLKRLRQQVDTIRATESVQRAQMAVARRQGGGDRKLQNALESLERIKLRQEQTQAELDARRALEERPSDLLEDKLKAAGIIVGEISAETVLERIREKKETGEDQSFSK